MIDLENDIFSTVSSAVTTEVAGCYVTGEYVETPARFPAVTLLEVDNRVAQDVRTDNIENAVRVMWEANIYSNKVNGKKEEAKSIANVLDTAFANIGFTRTFRQQVPNFKDATIFRIVCRYEAAIDKNYVIFYN